MAITSRQRVAMALLIVLGLLGTGAVLMTARHTSGEEAEHADPHEGQHEGQHEDTHEDKPGDKDAHAPEAQAHGEHEAHEEHEETRISLSAEQIKAAGITLQATGPGQLQASAEFQGEIRFNDDRTSHVVPRLAGVVEAVHADLGQQVKKGELLATVASTALAEQRSEWLTAQKRRDAARVSFEREKKLWEDRISAQQDFLQAQSALQEADIALQNAAQKLAAVGATGASAVLNRFEIRAPFAGTVVEKHLSLGEAVKEDASIFTVSDLSTVWADFAVAPKDLGTVRVGQRVIVSSTAFDSKTEGVIAYVGALLGEQTRTARARVALRNPGGAWRPGLFVTVAVLGEQQTLPLVVNADAVQSVEGQSMVFKAVDGGFAGQPVKLGRSDGRSVEVLGGLKAGEQIAASNTFVLKAELGKGSAEHEH
ncbi:efflux RND transporter periplasmic adaptor subunit [Ideonella azotifigens]|nr:efflux RND transporter periplasmic adaptor subunit [Ideonella azotifigens]MCD2343882.1 efflux RND transporter periplasmic adaptor subunit [Ideonella azotifigens]